MRIWQIKWACQKSVNFSPKLYMKRTACQVNEDGKTIAIAMIEISEELKNARCKPETEG